MYETESIEPMGSHRHFQGGGSNQHHLRLLILGIAAAALTLMALALPAFADARPNPVVTVTQSPANPVVPGQTIEFEVNVKNEGTTPTPNENWNFFIGQFGNNGLDFVSVEADDSFYLGTGGPCQNYTNNRVNCGRLASVIPSGTTVLEPGESAPPIHITARVAPDAPASIPFVTDLNIQNCATCSSRPSSLIQVTQGPVMELSMEHLGIFRRGQVGHYAIDLKNSSDSTDATGLATITDTLPDGLSFNSASSTGNFWDCVGSSGQNVSCVGNGNLAHGDSAPTLDLAVDVDSGAPDFLTNTASAETQGGVGQGLNSATDETPIFSAAAERAVFTVGATAKADPANETGSYLAIDNAIKDTDPFMGDFAKTSKPTLTGVIDGEEIFIPESGVDIPTFTGPTLADTGLPNTFGTKVTLQLHVSTVPTDDWTGTIGSDGSISLDMPAKFEYAPRLLTPLPLTVGNCESGPVNLAPSGTISNGNGVLTDNAFTVGAATCDYIGGIFYQQHLTLVLAGVFMNQWAGTAGGSASGAAHARFEMHLTKPESGPVLSVENSLPAGFGTEPKLHVVNGEVDPAGSSGGYDITVTNTGSAATAGPVNLTEQLPSGLAFDSASSTGNYWDCSASAGAEVSCVSDGSPIAVGDSAPVLNLTVKVALQAWPEVTTAASASGGGAEGTTTTPNNSAVQIDGPLLTLTVRQYQETSSKTYWTVGAPEDVIQISPRLLGAGTLNFQSKLKVRGNLPPGVKFREVLPPLFGSSAGWNCSDAPAATGSGRLLDCTVSAEPNFFGNYSFTRAALAFDVTGTAAAGESPVAAVQLQAWYPGALPETDPVFATGSTPVRRPHLDLTMSHEGDFRLGGSGGTFTLGLENTGNGSTTDNPTTITDVLPEGLIVQQVDDGGYWDCSQVGQKVTCDNANAPAILPDGHFGDSWDGEIGPGLSTPSITMDVTVKDPPVAELTNLARARNSASETGVASNTVNTGRPQLAVNSTHSGDFTVGENGSYRLLVSNEGATDTDGSPVTLTDTLPAGLSYVGATSAGDFWSCAAEGAKVNCSSDAVLEGNSSAPVVNLTVGVADAARPGVTNVARVSGGGSLAATTSDPTNVAAAMPVPPPPPPPDGKARFAHLKIRPKTRKARPGKKVVFKVKVRNNGSADTNHVKVCWKGPKRFVRGDRCKKYGGLEHGSAKKRRFKIRLKGKARKTNRIKLRFTAHAKKTKKRSANARIKVKSGKRHRK